MVKDLPCQGVISSSGETQGYRGEPIHAPVTLHAEDHTRHQRGHPLKRNHSFLSINNNALTPIPDTNLLNILEFPVTCVFCSNEGTLSELLGGFRMGTCHQKDHTMIRSLELSAPILRAGETGDSVNDESCLQDEASVRIPTEQDLEIFQVGEHAGVLGE